MKCKKVKELLLTDYYDSQLSKELVEQLKTHIKTCAGCAQLEKEISAAIPEILKNDIQLQAPQEIWLNIKDKIAQYEDDKKTLLSKCKDYLERITQNRKPVLALVPILAVIIILITVVRPRPVTEAEVVGYLEDQVEFYASLDNGGSNGISGNIDFETDIEYFFL
jgi:hypothetical protein